VSLNIREVPVIVASASEYKSKGVLPFETPLTLLSRASSDVSKGNLPAPPRTCIDEATVQSSIGLYLFAPPTTDCDTNNFPEPHPTGTDA
jgi:hypothetical protein